MGQVKYVYSTRFTARELQSDLNITTATDTLSTLTTEFISAGKSSGSGPHSVHPTSLRLACYLVVSVPLSFPPVGRWLALFLHGCMRLC